MIRFNSKGTIISSRIKREPAKSTKVATLPPGPNPLISVMGLTKDCVFYTFILGDTSTNTSLPSWTNKYEKTGHCEGKRLMQMRTVGREGVTGTRSV